jgi:hypothetical protein
MYSATGLGKVVITHLIKELKLTLGKADFILKDFEYLCSFCTSVAISYVSILEYLYM